MPSVWAVWGAGGAFSVPTPVFVVRSPFDSNLLNQAADSMSVALVLHLDLIDQYTEDAAGRSGGAEVIAYNVAISACGKDQQQLRERALDLWRCCGTNAY